MKKVAIIGTGISGLSAGWFLKEKHKNAIDLTFLEKKDRSGGLIRTIWENDFLFELGPRGFRPTGSGILTLELAKSLGLEKELIYAHENAKSRYIYQKGKLKKFSLPYLLQNGFLTAIFKDIFTKASEADEESIASFVKRRFGQKILENVMDPLVKGIYGGDPEKLSMKSAFPHFWNLEKKYGSVVKGVFSTKREKSTLVSFKKGMQTLTDTLAKKIDATFHYGANVHNIEKKGEAFLVETNLFSLEADVVILAIPDKEIARFFHLPPLILENVTLTTFNMGWKGKKLPLSGFGFLVPSKEKKEILGMTFDSDIFPEQGQGIQTRLTVMVKGNPTKDKLLQLVYSELDNLFQLGYPDAVTISPHLEAIPQYTLGYEKRLNAFKKSLPEGVFLVGNCFDGVSVNACIENGKKLADIL